MRDKLLELCSAERAYSSAVREDMECYSRLYNSKDSSSKDCSEMLEIKDRLQLAANRYQPIFGTNTKIKLVAEQLTLIEFQLFSQLEASELVNKAWGRADHSTTAPTLSKLQERFNGMSRWIATDIVVAGCASAQTLMMKKFIKLAWKVCICPFQHNLC